jgi:hypothetical protein
LKVIKGGAFFYITERSPDMENGRGCASEPYDGTVYGFGDPARDRLAIAAKGFPDGKENLASTRIRYHRLIQSFMTDMAGVDTPVNEVVSYSKLIESIQHAEEYQDGVRPVGHLWWKREEPVMKMNVWLEDKDVQTDKVVIGGPSAPAGMLTYSVARQEKTMGSDGYQAIGIVTQGVVAAKTDIDQVVGFILADPSLASKFFEGAFPKMEAKYHGQPNGRIVIAGRDEVSERLAHSQSLERIAVSYEV